MPQQLAQHLMSRGLLSAGVVDQALKRMARDGGGLDTALLEMGVISEAGMLQSVSDVSGVRLVNLADFEPNNEASPLVPFKMARQLMLVPLSLDGASLHVACAYPIPAAQLKDVGFLLGRKLDLWVALECRVRDWQATVYGQPLEPRYSLLLQTLDPSRKKALTENQKSQRATVYQEPSPRSRLGLETETLSSEVLERVAAGIVEEPLLLAAPKKKTKTELEVIPLGEEEEPRTTVLDANEYSRFAKASEPPRASQPSQPSKPAKPPPPVEPIELTPKPRPSAPPIQLWEEENTREVDTSDYATLIQQARSPERARPKGEVPPPRISFPGGVLPPRKETQPEAAPTPRKPEPATWLHPASAARPATERPRPSSPAPAPAPPRASIPSQPPTAAVEAPPPPPPAPQKLERAPAKHHPAPIPEPDATPPSGDSETDFSDVNEVLHPPKPPPVEVPPEPPPAVLSPPSRLTGAKPPTLVAPSAPLPPPMPLVETVETLEPVAAARPSAARHLETVTESSNAPAEAWQVTSPAHALPPPPPVNAPAVPLAGLNLAEAGSGILPAPPGLAPASATEWTLAQARASLKAASTDREQLISVVLEYGRRAFEYVCSFAVMRGAAYGWDARGDGDLEAIRQAAIPLDAGSVFRTVALTRGSYVGPLPPDALTQHYLAQLGRAPRTVFMWPVEVQSRLVAILYGDCGARPVSQRRLADFILFCQDLPSAFHELIVFRKQNPRVPQTFTPTPQLMPEAMTAEMTDAPAAYSAPTDADWFYGLIQLLTGPDPTERSMAMLELMKTPDSSAQALAQAFPGPTGWSRLPVVDLPEPDELGPIPGAIARLGPSGGYALAPLLDSNDSDTRYLALLTAGSLRYPEVIDGVLRGLFDLEPDISSAARAAASSLKYLAQFQAKLPSLRQELTSNDNLRRSLASRALGVLHDRDAIEGLINLTGSEDELCAQSAAEALKEITRAAFGPNPRAWTAWYANARTQRRIVWLVEALASYDFDLRLSAIEELSKTFGDNYGFFADGPDAERAAALSNWRQAIASRPDLDV